MLHRSKTGQGYSPHHQTEAHCALARDDPGKPQKLAWRIIESGRVDGRRTRPWDEMVQLKIVEKQQQK